MVDEILTKVDWNSAMKLSEEIVTLIIQANRYYLAGNIPRFFSSLKCIKFTAIASIRQKDRDKLKKIELEIRIPFSKMLKKQTGFNSGEKYVGAQAEACILAEKYGEEIMDILQKTGFLMGEKRDISKFGNVEFVEADEE